MIAGFPYPFDPSRNRADSLLKKKPRVADRIVSMLYYKKMAIRRIAGRPQFLEETGYL